MATVDAQTVWELAGALSGDEPGDELQRTAQVTRIDRDGTVWVHMEGGVDETPVRSTAADVQVGDTVGVQWGSNAVSVTGNSTAPATSARGVAQQTAPVRLAAEAAERDARAASNVASEARAVAEATNQHFWTRSDDGGDGAGTGAFVTDMPQDEWLEGASRDFDDLTDDKPYANFLINSLGGLIRRGKTRLAQFTKSAVAFYDGVGSAESNIVARFGTDGAQIGRVGESRQVFDYRSLRMVDKEGNDYFHVSDLRDSGGEASITDKFIGDGTTKSFGLSFQATGTQYEVSVSDSSGGNVSKTITGVTFSAAPTDGAEITVSYATTSVNAKAYTLGRRGNGSIGGMSFASGRSCVSSGYCSHAEGSGTTASGNYSHAEGEGTTASRYSSHAEGNDTTASGSYSHAEGEATTASGNCSHAEGEATTASGNCSHAEGDGTTASGSYSHAEGSDTTASGSYSHAQNVGTVAASTSQTAIGQYNKRDAQNKYAFIIGNGSSDNARSNAFAVDWYGNIECGSRTVADIPDIISPGSGVTVDYAQCAIFGKAASLAITFSYSSAISNGAQITLGTIKSDKRPDGGSAIGSARFAGHIASDGKAYLRNVQGTTLAANTSVTVYATYILS